MTGQRGTGAQMGRLLADWRDAERAWEQTGHDGPEYRLAGQRVLRAWLAYQEAAVATDTEMVLVTDDDRRFVAVNTTACTMLGYAVDDLLGRRIEDITQVDHSTETAPLWSSFLSAGRLDGRYWLRRRDGETLPVSFQARAHFPIPGFHLSRLRLADDSGGG